MCDNPSSASAIDENLQRFVQGEMLNIFRLVDGSLQLEPIPIKPALTAIVPHRKVKDLEARKVVEKMRTLR